MLSKREINKWDKIKLDQYAVTHGFKKAVAYDLVANEMWGGRDTQKQNISTKIN
jgi:hypothetical protein